LLSVIDDNPELPELKISPKVTDCIKHEKVQMPDQLSIGAKRTYSDMEKQNHTKEYIKHKIIRKIEHPNFSPRQQQQQHAINHPGPFQCVPRSPFSGQQQQQQPQPQNHKLFFHDENEYLEKYTPNHLTRPVEVPTRPSSVRTTPSDPGVPPMFAPSSSSAFREASLDHLLNARSEEVPPSKLKLLFPFENIREETVPKEHGLSKQAAMFKNGLSIDIPVNSSTSNLPSPTSFCPRVPLFKSTSLHTTGLSNMYTFAPTHLEHQEQCSSSSTEDLSPAHIMRVVSSPGDEVKHYSIKEEKFMTT